MIDFFKDAFRIIVDFILAIPMPWRAGIFLIVFGYLGYQIGRRLLVLLLLPEYWVTSLMRSLNRRPLPGTLLFDSLVGWLIKVSRWAVWLAVILALASVIAWYQRPNIESSTLARYIDEGFDWWYSFENSLTSSR
jgi:hypothetical protein